MRLLTCMSSAVIPDLAQAPGHGRLDPLAGGASLVSCIVRPPDLFPLASAPGSPGIGRCHGPAPQPGQGRHLLSARHAVTHCPGMKTWSLRLFPEAKYAADLCLRNSVSPFLQLRLYYLHFIKDLANKRNVFSTHRFLSPAQGLLSQDDDAVFEDAVAPVWRKKCTLLRENNRVARYTSLPEEKLELLPMDMLPVELPFLKLSLFSSESLLLASRSAAATSILYSYFW